MESNITFVVFARDESHRLPYLLRNLKGYGEILVILDDRTVDNTEEIARSYGARIHRFKNPGWTEGEDIMKLVMSLAGGAWLYWAYADELLPPPLLYKMVEISRQDKYKVAWMRRKNFHYGGVNLENGLSVRFFKKGAIDFAGNIIGHFGKIVVPDREVLYLPETDVYSIHHYSTYNVEKFELAHSKYSSWEAKANFESGYRKFSGFKLILKPPYVFLRYMILGGAWRWGWRGIIIAAQYGFFYFNILAKMWEIENGVTLESIEKSYDEKKEGLLRQFS